MPLRCSTWPHARQILVPVAAGDTLGADVERRAAHGRVGHAVRRADDREVGERARLAAQLSRHELTYTGGGGGGAPGGG